MAKSLRILYVLASIVGVHAHAADVSVELNRLDSHAGGCAAQMVVSNASATAYTGFVLDLVIFDKDGRIERRTLMDLAPMRASKTTVYKFDLKNLQCEMVGSILLNDVAGCAQASGEVADCVDNVDASSRATASFKK